MNIIDRRVVNVAIVIIMVPLGFGCHGRQLTQSTKAYPYSVILDKRASYERLLSVMNNLPSTPESAGFWTHIANDPAFPDYHRRLCILQLFRRQVQAGMSLMTISKILDRPTWLKSENIFTIKSVIGKIPVNFDFDDTVFSIIILPEAGHNTSAVYLKVQGVITAEQLIHLLQTREGEKQIRERVLLEMAVNENNP